MAAECLWRAVSVFQPVLININPKTTTADGTCGNTTATLRLNDGNSTSIAFTFVVVSNLFYIKLSPTVLHDDHSWWNPSAGGRLFPDGKQNWLADWLKRNRELGKSCRKCKTEVNVLDFVKHVFLKLKTQNCTLTVVSCLLNRKIQVQMYQNFIWKRWMLHCSTIWMVLVSNGICLKASISFYPMYVSIKYFWLIFFFNAIPGYCYFYF